jgi:integrase
MQEIEFISEVKHIKGASFEKLPSGSFRVKLAKSLTGCPLQKKSFSTEDEAINFVNQALKELRKREDKALNLTITERADAGVALDLLSKFGVDLTLTEVIRKYCNGLPNAKPVLVKNAVTEYLDSQSGEVSDPHYKNLKTYLINEGSLSKLYGEEYLHEIGKDDIAEWLRIRCRKRSKNTYDAFLVQTRAFFNWCIKEKKWLVENPGSELSKYNDTPADPEVFTPKQAKELLQCLKDNDMEELMLGMAIQLFAGVRRAEVLRLTWGDFTDEKIRLSKKVTKTKKGRAVPLSTALKRIIKEKEQYLNEDCDKEHVVTLNHDEWDTHRTRAMRILKWEDWPHNGLRHSYASYRLNVSDLETTAYEAGHSTGVLQEHYDGLVDAKDSKTYFNIKLK